MCWGYLVIMSTFISFPWQFETIPVNTKSFICTVSCSQWSLKVHTSILICAGASVSVSSTRIQCETGCHQWGLSPLYHLAPPLLATPPHLWLGWGYTVTHMYTVQCTMYTVHCTLYTAHRTLYTLHCKLYMWCTLIIPKQFPVLYSLQWAKYELQCTAMRRDIPASFSSITLG